MVLESHLFLRLSLGFVWECWVLWENIYVFTQKLSVHFLDFLFKWKGVNPTNISDKICRK